MDFFNLTGGLAYHYKAWRYRRLLWDSHRFGTAQWLQGWRTYHCHLILIGPSAGYSLPRSFLEKFERLTALDPDPISARLFQSRFKGLNVQWSRQDYFHQKNGRLWPEGLFHLREEYDQAVFLFCNFLGQLPLTTVGFEESLDLWRKNWLVFLQNSEWASFHDLWSTDQPLPTQEPWQASKKGLQDSIQRFAPKDFKGTIRDHLTENLFNDSCHRSQWLWHLKPGQTHCIEGVRPSKQDIGI